MHKRLFKQGAAIVVVTLMFALAFAPTGLVYAQQSPTIEGLRAQIEALHAQLIALLQARIAELQRQIAALRGERRELPPHLPATTLIRVPVILLDGASPLDHDDPNRMRESLETGRRVGCGDSIAFIEKRIPHTTMPLTAIYRELFGEDEITRGTRYINQIASHSRGRVIRMTGQPDLIIRPLQFDRVVIDNNIATVHLTGEYASLGTCEPPRTEAQLKFAAKQFPWIREVRIYIEGRRAEFVHGGPDREVPITQEPELTEEIALRLILENFPIKHCKPMRVVPEYSFCALIISKERDRWLVTVTYYGLFDDSVRTERLRTIVEHHNGQWVRGNISSDWQCQPGRGRQDFSTELCL